MAERIDSRVSIGHVHLKVADLDRAVAFYAGVLGFEVTARMGPSAAFLSAGGYHHHIGLNTWESLNGSPPPSNTTGLYHAAIRYPTRATLADALRRLVEAHVPLEGASDHGVSEALYLRDPDGNGIELYWDRPRDQWPRSSDGALQMTTARLDVEALLADAPSRQANGAAAVGSRGDLSEASRTRLSELRGRLLALHKSLLDDAHAAYEMDRGRVSSPGNLLQLVINDPWFAWLHPLSELVVRIDEAAGPDSAFTEGDAKALLEHVDRLLLPSETGDTFARRYFEALQRQPAVVLAHGAVKRVLKSG
jgi:catechol 2,3-dioxygenase